MDFKERFYPFMLAADLDGAWAFLTGLEGDELKIAKTWFQRRHNDLLD